MKICSIVISEKLWEEITLQSFAKNDATAPIALATIPAGATFIKMEVIKGDLHIIYSIDEPDVSTLTLDIGSTKDVPDFFSDDPQASNYRIDWATGKTFKKDKS